jgi:outer membrane protein assembly factor BamB
MNGSRRRFLRAAGAAAAMGLAGCASLRRSVLGVPGRVDVDGPPADGADAQFRGGLDRRGVFPDASIPEAVTVDWRLPDVNTGDHTAAKASPVRAPTGDVVVPGDTGELRAVTPAGEVRWTTETDADGRGIHGTPAIANGAVYVGAYDGALYAFDLATGERYWRAPLGGAIGSSPGYHDGTVYIAVEFHPPDGAMFGVDAVTGEVEWRGDRPTDHPHSTCAIDREAGRLVVGSNDGSLYAWTYPGLEFAWAFDTGGAIKGPVATYDGSAFFGSWDERIYRVGLDDGAEEWTYHTGGLVMSGPSIEPSTGTLYAGGHDSRLYALDLAGEERWTFDTGGRLLGCPTVTAESVLVGSYDRRLYAVDKRSGAERWRVAADGWVTSTPLVTGDGIYVTARASGDYLDDGEGRTGALYRLRAAE